MSAFNQLERDSFRMRHTLYHQKRPQSALSDAGLNGSVGEGGGGGGGGSNAVDIVLRSGTSLTSLTKSKHVTDPDLASLANEEHQPPHIYDSLPKNFKCRGTLHWLVSKDVNLSFKIVNFC